MEKVRLFQDKRVRTHWDAEREEWFFSVEDVVGALTDATDPTDYLKQMLERDPELAAFLETNCPEVDMLTETGERWKTLTADSEAVLRMIQSIPTPKAEPFKQWLAQVGEERPDEIAAPERARKSRSSKCSFVVYTLVILAVIIGVGVGMMAWLTKHEVAEQAVHGVHFYMEENEEGFSFWGAKLHAVVDGVDHVVELTSSTEEPMCILLEDTIDIDGDGDVEAVVRNVQACGGNAIGDCFFVVKYKGDGDFSVSDDMGSDAGDIQVETWNGQTSFVIINGLPDHGLQKLRYVYEDGQVKLVEISDVIGD